MALSSREEFFERTLECVARGSYAVEGEEYRLSVDRYYDPAWFDRERSAIFHRFPLIVAHESQVCEPGDCLAIDFLDKPLLLVRGADRRLRAFLNVCRHRGTQLVEPGQPCKRRRITCPYHSWTYALDGSLIGVPHEAQCFPNLDRTTHGLKELPLAVSHGFVWVSLLPANGLALNDFLAGITRHWDDFELGTYCFLREKPCHVQANWKAIYDAFCEGYHVQRLHRETLAEFFMDNIGYTERTGPHMVTSIAREEISAAVEGGRAAWNLQEQSTFVYHLFPNSILVFSPDYVNLIALVPISPSETLARVMMLIPTPPSTEEEAAHWERSFDLVVEGVFTREDFRVAELAQKGLESQANSHFTIGRFEWPIRNFHDQLEEAIRAHAEA